MEQSILANPGPTPLYSSRAIRGFSIVFSAVAGGFLLWQNLKDLGRPDAARKALWGSIAYTVAITALLSLLPDRPSGGNSIGLVVGLAGGMGLAAYYEKIVANKDDFPAKSVGKPLLICLLIFVPLIASLIYLMTLDGDAAGTTI